MSYTEEMKIKKKEKAIELWTTSYANDTEICAMLGISRDTLNTWLNEDADFKRIRDKARTNPTLKAKANVMKAIDNGDQEASRYWLSKRSEEFSDKTVQEVNIGLQDKISERVEEIAKALEKI